MESFCVAGKDYQVSQEHGSEGCKSMQGSCSSYVKDRVDLRKEGRNLQEVIK